MQDLAWRLSTVLNPASPPRPCALAFQQLCNTAFYKRGGGGGFRGLIEILTHCGSHRLPSCVLDNFLSAHQASAPSWLRFPPAACGGNAPTLEPLRVDLLL